MKKSIIAVVILIAIGVALPIVGNSFMQKTIEDKVNKLESFGLEVQQQSTQSSYLSTHKHFEFLLKDSAAFVEYLNEYSNQQLPPYVNAMLNGVVIGTDIEYSNLPFAKAIEIEIYPLSLSKKMKNEMKKENLAFSTYLENFLESKGILYHISYNTINSEFKGYIKDIETSYDFDKELKIDFKLKSAIFSGKGDIIAPEKLKSKIKSFHISILNQKKKLDIQMINVTSKNKFDSKNRYETDMKLDALNLILSGTQSDANITMKDLIVSASSNDSKEKTELKSKVTFKKFRVDSKEHFVDMKKFAFKINIKDLDKNAFEKFRSLASKNNLNNSMKYKKDLQNSLLSLLSKGLTIDSNEFSIKDVDVDNIGNLKGFDIKTKIVLKEDPAFSQKIALSPMMALEDLEIHINMKINKKMYSYMMQNPGLLMQLNSYAKEDGDSVVFDIDFLDSKISVNGQTIN